MMTPDERQLLSGLFDRVRAGGTAPRDLDAEALINEAVRAQPYAPYLLAQTVIVQDHALRAANDRLQTLEARVQELESRPAASAGGGSFLGGLGKSIFGGSEPSRSVPQRPLQSGNGFAPQPAGPWGGQPQQQQAPQYAPQMQQPMQRGGGGSSFLTGALGAAAGVAGGVLMADSIKGLFGGHANPMGGMAGGMFPGMGTPASLNSYDNGQTQNALADADQTQDELQDANDYGSSADNSSDNSADYGSDGGGTDV